MSKTDQSSSSYKAPPKKRATVKRKKQKKPQVENYSDQTWQMTISRSVATKLGYPKEELGLEKINLIEAFTHRTFAHEYNQRAIDQQIADNQRLEFLGDAILGYICTIKIFALAPQLSEGELSALRATLINRTTLKNVAISAGFEPHLRLGRGEVKMGEAARAARLADLTEAVIGAIYLDLGLEVVKEWVWKQLRGFLDLSSIDDQTLSDPKTELQHWAHKMHKITPKYVSESMIKKEQTLYRSEVFIGKCSIGVGLGVTKRESQREAASQALKSIDLQKISLLNESF